MNPDAILEEHKGLSSRQLKYFLLFGFPVILITFQNMSVVFHMAIPQHSCSLPDRQTLVNESASASLKTQTSNVTLPSTKLRALECKYVENTSRTSGINSTYDGEIREVKCDSWDYDKSVYDKTIVSEMDIVCDRKIDRAHAQMMYMFGFMMGIFPAGLASDRVGRKPTVIVFLTGSLVFSIIQCFSVNYPMFLAIRLLSGFCDSGVFGNCFVLCLELVAPSYRTAMGFGLEYFWCVGLIILTGLAYFVRDWRHLQMAISFPFVPLVGLWWFLPESPKFLVTKGRVEEAITMMNKIIHPRKLNAKEAEKHIAEGDHVETGHWMQLFSNRRLCVRMIIIWINWMVVSCAFYGLSLNVGNLGGSLYMNFFINVLVEFAAYTLGILLLNRCGRKVFHCGSMILGGVTCIGTLVPVIYGTGSLYWLTITLAMSGKFGASLAFAVIYIYTAELFPTFVRSKAISSSSICARIGAIISPYIAELGNIIEGDFGTVLPLLIIGIATIAAGLLALLLPETTTIRLPDSIEEAKEIGR